jgi:lauroyl/myristoyl acyltransferase
MELSVSVLHAVLAQRGGARVYPILPIPDPDGGCTVVIYPELEITPECTLREIAQRCWDVFEPFVCQHPGLWLWPYKHFRVKPRGAQVPYPSYANESGAFEKLRRRELGGA